MGKLIFYSRLFLVLWLLFSCGTNNFAKRKYMKGRYIPKREHVKVASKSTRNNKYRFRNSISKKEENCIRETETKEKEEEIHPENESGLRDNIDSKDLSKGVLKTEESKDEKEIQKLEDDSIWDTHERKAKVEIDTGISLTVIGAIMFLFALTSLAWIFLPMWLYMSLVLVGIGLLIAGAIILARGVKRKKYGSYYEEYKRQKKIRRRTNAYGKLKSGFGLSIAGFICMFLAFLSFLLLLAELAIVLLSVGYYLAVVAIILLSIGMARSLFYMKEKKIHHPKLREHLIIGFVFLCLLAVVGLLSIFSPLFFGVVLFWILYGVTAVLGIIGFTFWILYLIGFKKAIR